LTQLSVGGFLVELAAIASGAGQGDGMVLHAALCLGLGWAGLIASVLHLGRPLYAYRALIGLGHSWLSREVLAFGLFAALGTVSVVLDLIEPDRRLVSDGLRLALLGAVVVSGLAGVASSVMVYHVVRHEFWSARHSGIRFAGTAVILGLAIAMVALALARVGRTDAPDAISSSLYGLFAIGLITASSAKLGVEAILVRGYARSERMTLRKTAHLLSGVLRRQLGLRNALGLTGGILLPALALVGWTWGHAGTTAAVATLAWAASMGAEVAERYLFFTAVVRPKMPGGLMP
jgi:DMSO reductase anchor subunit